MISFLCERSRIHSAAAHTEHDSDLFHFTDPALNSPGYHLSTLHNESTSMLCGSSCGVDLQDPDPKKLEKSDSEATL